MLSASDIKLYLEIAVKENLNLTQEQEAKFASILDYADILIEKDKPINFLQLFPVKI